ncbi:DUF2946 domain-containing protein [Massilia sp. TS11]|uniref:DUF2946 domain-containing protein n=1 Tax=Massilia sp. TS11 TaxID=2908003 RepID=UPI001EDA5957|nr:DUF2946 domain-containing protein [Massilia sp. TS11]MCG2583074.1 DUF2946 domain-containing protein [Massilia sp. TS11]
MLSRAFPVRFAAWLACVAVLLAALMPSVSHLLAANPATAPLVELCSADSVKKDMAGAGHLEHCAYCATHDGSLGLAPTLLGALPLPLARHEVPQLFLHSPQPLFAWATPQSRAPPVLA